MAALIPVIDGEGVAREHAGQPGLILGLFGGQDAFGRGAAAIFRARRRGGT